MRSAWWSSCVVVLAAGSCGFPRLPELPTGELELLAGDIGGFGNEDGTGAAAHFHSPDGVAVDSAGNVYVADRFNSTIRKVTAAGVVTTLAGTAGVVGSRDFVGAGAAFARPQGVAVDPTGNVYVADTDNATIRKITAAGVVTTLAGTAGMLGSADGRGAGAAFNVPRSVAADSAGNVYVADAGNHTIRKVTAAGVVTTLAGTAGMLGSADGTGAAAHFNAPSGVAVDSAGNVYVADAGNHTIRKVTPAGAATTLAGTAGMSGKADGTGAVARFLNPEGVAVDSSGNVYVADGNATIRKITAAGVVTTLAGTAGMPGSADGTGAAARFSEPSGVAVDSAGNVYVADSGNDAIRKITAAGAATTTLTGAADMVGSADGAGSAARFRGPSGVAVDGAGNAYVADQINDTIRKVTTAGDVTTLAGVAGPGTGSADGTGAAARFAFPAGVAIDGAGNVYVADRLNATIRKVTPAGVVTTLAGTAGMVGSADGTGAAARFSDPSGVAVDSASNVYVADRSNHTIRKVTAAGVVTTVAGTAGISGNADGTGAAAGFYFPMGVAVDRAGNLYVTDTSNETIRKITPAGVVKTLAGAVGVPGSSDGAGAGALFNLPTGVAVDDAGNVYVTDSSNATIRKVTPAGVTTTVAGVAGVTGIALGADPRFAAPQYLAIVGDSIVITDTNAVLLLRHGAP
ncbi:MAG TPA: NHL repeat-containing protein [Kofleriaceae bacterium]|jgi:sugar lactone lactonase YvrE|nr:NHL repeat-containing protein [Kofleriaceae bacterium]